MCVCGCVCDCVCVCVCVCVCIRTLQMSVQYKMADLLLHQKRYGTFETYITTQIHRNK